MQPIEQGDIFLPLMARLTIYSGGVLTSGEDRIKLYQISKDGVTKASMIIDIGEQHVIIGSCTDGENYYCNLDVAEINASSPTEVHSIYVLKVASDGTVTYNLVQTGQASPIVGNIRSVMISTNGCGTLWVGSRYAVGLERLYEFDYETFIATGSEQDTGTDSFWTARFVTEEELLLCRTGNTYSQLYTKNMLSSTEALVYDATDDPPGVDRILFGADFDGEDVVIGMMQDPAESGDAFKVYQVVNGVEYEIVEFDTVDDIMAVNVGLQLTLEKDYVIFHSMQSATPIVLNPQTHTIWRAPLATAGVVEVLWQESFSDMNDVMVCQGICVISPQGFCDEPEPEEPEEEPCLSTPILSIPACPVIASPSRPMAISRLGFSSVPLCGVLPAASHPETRPC